MNEAVHRFKRTKVLASSTEAARPFPYVCPLCGVRVHYVRDFTRYNGDYVSARFDHEANSVRARSCKWFRQGSENSGSGPGHSARTVNSRSSPRLMIRVAKGKWNLGIFMPRFEGDHGTFDFGDASPALTPFDLSSVPAAGEVYDVYPQTEPYVVEIRTRDSSPTRIPIGAIGEFSIFAGSTGWGRCLGEDEILAWNKSYLAIGSKLPAAFLKLVLARLLLRATRQMFDATLFKLPATPDAAIVRVAKAVLGREIQHEDLVATVVAPITAHCSPDGTWLVPVQSGGLVVAYAFGEPTKGANSVRMISPGSEAVGHPHVVPAGTTRGCIRFQATDDSYCEIHFDAAPANPLCIRPVAASDLERRTPWPTFAFGIEFKGAIHACPLWRADLPEFLAKIRRTEAKLTDVRAPVGASVIIQVASGGQVDRKTFSFSDSLSEPEFESQERAVADMVRAGLAGGREVLIDAGGFGRALLPVNEPAPARPARPSTSLRGRWLDLVRQARGLSPGRSRHLAPRLRRFRAHLKVEQQLP